jgi:hypothetical protein
MAVSEIRANVRYRHGKFKFRDFRYTKYKTRGSVAKLPSETVSGTLF